MNNKKVVENYFKVHAFDMLSVPMGKLKYPFVVPGPQYSNDLWDWDSFYSIVGLFDICEYFKGTDGFDYQYNYNRVVECAKGSILNFLDAQLDDGFIPIIINDTRLTDGIWAENHFKYDKDNQHKPFICQGIMNIYNRTGDLLWFDVERVIKYIEYYKREQFDERSGFYVWKSDSMIGIDNNPSVFGMPSGSVADIYLNVFMYLELKALTDLLRLLKDERENLYDKECNRLKNLIIKQCFDDRDGLYYSQFIDLAKEHTGQLHQGFPLFWKGVSIKIRHACSLLPMYAGISTKEQNKTIIKRHLLDKKFLSPYGLRSLSCDEKIYNISATSNPSNSLGPVWFIYNYFAFKGLMNEGKRKLAKDICNKMILLFARDIKENDKTSESYHPDTGKPLLEHGFLSWNVLIISMLKELRN